MSTRLTIGALAVVALAGTASAQITSANGYNMNYRNIFNAFPGSTINVNGSGTPATVSGLNVTLQEQIPANSPGGFANRHFSWLSTDGGTTPYRVQANESFQIDFTMRLSRNVSEDGRNIEGGIWFWPEADLGATNFRDGGLFVVSNGAVFVGGADAEFSLMGERAGAPGTPPPPLYFAGDLARVSFIYFAPGEVNAATGAYRVIFENVTQGRTVDTGIRLWNNEALLNPNPNPGRGIGLTGAAVGFRSQFSNVAFEDNTITSEYNVLRIIPTPGAAAVLGLGGLMAMRRRRA